jgi:PilZ domain-containing protein
VFGVFPFRCQACARRFRTRSAAHFQRMQVDRREYERVPVRLPATFIGHHQRGEGEISALSLGGCTMRTRTPLANGDAMRLSFHVPRAPQPIVIDVALVRSTPPGAVGLHFEQISVAEHARLRALMGALVGRPDGLGPHTAMSRGLDVLNRPTVWAAVLILLVAAVVATVFPLFSQCIWGLTC